MCSKIKILVIYRTTSLSEKKKKFYWPLSKNMGVAPSKT